MTKVPSKITTEKGKHRLHDPLFNFMVINSSFFIALAAINGKSEIPAGQWYNMQCKQLHGEIRLAFREPLEFAAKGVVPDKLEFGIAEPMNFIAEGARKGPNLTTSLCHLISPIFVEFVERYTPWLEKSQGKQALWPDLWRFARVVRNAISHDGKVFIAADIRKKGGLTSTSWKNLTYSSVDHGRHIIGHDLLSADILLLMFELNDELDGLGCPVL